MTGKEIRLGRLLGEGKAVIVAADHGSYMGPFAGIENLPQQIFKYDKADAVLLMPGMIKQCKHFFSRKNAPLCIARLNWASHYCKPYSNIYTKGYNEKLNEVEYAVAVGADAIILSLLLGTDEEANTRNLSQFSQLVESADKLGIPVIGEYIPAGGIDRYEGEGEIIALGTRVCAELGADLVKTVFVEDFEKVTSSSTVPVLALGGAKTDKPSDAFRIALKAVQMGAAGVVFGRNVISAEDPEKYLESLISVVKEELSPEEAEEAYLASLNK